MSWHIRYIPGTDLARRFPPVNPGRPYPTAEAADTIRRTCPNAASMEVYEDPDGPAFDSWGRPMRDVSPAPARAS